MDTVITLTAEQTIQQAPALQQQLARALLQEHAIILELSQVTEIDCAAVQILIWLIRKSQQQNLPLALRHPSPAIRDFVSLLGLTELQLALGQAHES